ncbi:hypothetical protein EAG_14255 [Camponotus floridanus]|uniref:Uncharacterized protein n=1 Tax=Camponotus floridanus TaxID=104421 RepID=E2AN83_CAMFO|nr:hypothetical protein EAG_14255 [Camponotus floridanus]
MMLLVKLAFHWEFQEKVHIPGFMNIKKRQRVRTERRWRRYNFSYMWGDAPENPQDEEDIFNLRQLSGKSLT